MLLGSSPVFVGGVLTFSVLFIVIDVDGTDEVVADTNEVVAVVNALNVVVTVVLVFFVDMILRSGCSFTLPTLWLAAFHQHHHGLIFVVQCIGYCLETSSV